MMTRIKNFVFGLATATVLLASCKSDSNSSDKKTQADIFSKVYSVQNLKTQTFTIDNSIDNLIKGESGTVLNIKRNTFVDGNGKFITGKVDVKLIEALTKVDFVLGNLTTTFDGKPLETGGMIYLDAASNNAEVSIASGKSIQIKVPAKSKLPGMSLFEGQKDSSGIKWLNPLKLPAGENTSTVIVQRATNVRYSVDGFDTGNIPQFITSEVSRIGWQGDGLKIKADSVFKIDTYTVRFYKQVQFFTNNDTFTNTKGINSFAEDQKISYIFSIKKLGWANIDRLLEDPRTKDVELITSIDNQKDFNFIYVTMITNKMYLPGYQKRDETFCFSHNDEEKQQLPVGETATILATAYKNDKPYFAIKKITITDKQAVSLKLEETSMEKLKTEVKAKI